MGPDLWGAVLAASTVAGLEALVDAEFVQRTLVLPCQDPATGIRVDFIFTLTPYERQAVGRALSVDVDGALVRYARVEDLVIHKLVAGRPRDVEDVLAVLRKNTGLDRAYVKQWLAEFSEVVERPLGEQFDTLWQEAHPDQT